MGESGGWLTAVGVAVRNASRMGRAKLSWAQVMKRLRSVLEMPPIGLRSALEQSYLAFCLSVIFLGLKSEVD